MQRKILIVFTAILLVAGCAPQNPTARVPRPQVTPVSQGDLTPITTIQVAGKFTFAPGDGSIWVQDPVSQRPRPIVKPSAEVFSDAPHFSPDGKRVVYVRSSIQADGKARNELHTLSIDGSDDQTVAIPQNAGVNFNWPAYSRDGKWIYFTALQADPVKQQISEIHRVAVAGGDTQKLVDDGRIADISPDGSKIVFLRFNFESFTAGLWLADANGKNERELLNDQVFVTINAPHFSPDGQSVLFVASGPNTRPLPGVSFHQRTCEPQLLCLLAQPANANGLPWDLWTVTLDASKFTRLSKVGSDSPWPAWSRDGKQIAFFDTSGMYLLDIATQVVSQINRNSGHGIFDWSEP